jgi:hypothetical protein
MGLPGQEEPDRIARLRALSGRAPRAGSLPLPLSSQPATVSWDPGCGFHPTIRLFCSVPMPTDAVSPPFSLSPCEGGRTFAGRFRQCASGGDGFVVRKKKSAQTEAPGVAGQKRFPVKLRMMERGRPRVEAGPACHPYARIFFAAAVTSGTTLKRSSTIP